MDRKEKIIIKTDKTAVLSNDSKCIIIKYLQENFSPIELRSELSQLNAFLHPNYRVSYVKNKKIIAFVLWWDFGNLRFIEYICVLKKYRNQGIGSSLIKSCIDANIVTVVEVEENSKVCIFYQKNDFVQNNYIYQAIPLQNNFYVGKYNIFSYRKVLSRQEWDSFVSLIHQDEYQF